ncbi:unnamed protein product [Rhizoctonia solani]|uniref:Uncharacterized protein n=1 Tax=Rhizoctonia solani TaxID=456999 RepID=A0A8H3C7U7_9AGAM|nr:unnamed protein product [Rhizoctonia solani]
MATIFTTTGYTCAPATLTYDDDDRLINVVMNRGTKGTYTFKTDHNPSGNLHPFAGQIFCNDIDNLPTEDVDYKLCTGGKYAVVTIGDPEQPTTAVVVAHNERIIPKKYNEGRGEWSIAHAKPEPRRHKGPPSSAGDY